MKNPPIVKNAHVLIVIPPDLEPHEIRKDLGSRREVASPKKILIRVQVIKPRPYRSELHLLYQLITSANPYICTCMEIIMKLSLSCLVVAAQLVLCWSEDKLLPVVINTWPFVDANKGGNWEDLSISSLLLMKLTLHTCCMYTMDLSTLHIICMCYFSSIFQLYRLCRRVRATSIQ